MEKKENVKDNDEKKFAEMENKLGQQVRRVYNEDCFYPLVALAANLLMTVNYYNEKFEPMRNALREELENLSNVQQEVKDKVDNVTSEKDVKDYFQKTLKTIYDVTKKNYDLIECLKLETKRMYIKVTTIFYHYIIAIIFYHYVRN